MSGCIKYFDNGGKNMSFVIKDDNILIKYKEIQNKIKKTLNIKFHSIPVYDEKYTKVKVKKSNGVVNINLLDDEVLKEGVHHNCIACISTDFLEQKKQNYPQVYLEDCKYRAKKKKMPGFIDVKLESDSRSNPE